MYLHGKISRLMNALTQVNEGAHHLQAAVAVYGSLLGLNGGPHQKFETFPAIVNHCGKYEKILAVSREVYACWHMVLDNCREKFIILASPPKKIDELCQNPEQKRLLDPKGVYQLIAGKSFVRKYVERQHHGDIIIQAWATDKIEETVLTIFGDIQNVQFVLMDADQFGAAVSEEQMPLFQAKLFMAALEMDKFLKNRRLLEAKLQAEIPNFVVIEGAAPRVKRQAV